MMTTSDDWRTHARQLAMGIAGEEIRGDRAWRSAIEHVPRHLFVPRFYEQYADGGWEETTECSPGWLATVYRNEPLVTHLTTLDSGHQITASSSTKPGLMVRMLTALDIRPGHHVLEIGTGTGYNAALLAYLLGETHVYSVDIDDELVAAARDRLAHAGYHPTVTTSDGLHGSPEHAPYDRILATCSVPAIPWAWAEQINDGGLVLVDLKRSTHAGNLVLLRKYADRLEGRFLPKWAGFMAIRHATPVPNGPPNVFDPDALTDITTTTLEPPPGTDLVPWFLAHSRIPTGLFFGYHGISAAGAKWATMTAADGSACAVAMGPENDIREVRQSGPSRLWDAVENAHREWELLGKPGWGELGLTVHTDGAHEVWLDHPNSDHRWEMAST